MAKNYESLLKKSMRDYQERTRKTRPTTRNLVDRGLAGVAGKRKPIKKILGTAKEKAKILKEKSKALRKKLPVRPGFPKKPTPVQTDLEKKRKIIEGKLGVKPKPGIPRKPMPKKQKQGPPYKITPMEYQKLVWRADSRYTPEDYEVYKKTGRWPVSKEFGKYGKIMQTKRRR